MFVQLGLRNSLPQMHRKCIAVHMMTMAFARFWVNEGFRWLHAGGTTTESYIKSTERPPLSVSVYPGGSNDLQPVTITRSRSWAAISLSFERMCSRVLDFRTDVVTNGAGDHDSKS